MVVVVVGVFNFVRQSLLTRSFTHSLPTLGSTMISRENTDFDLNRDE